jgi:hypothetical protein
MNRNARSTNADVQCKRKLRAMFRDERCVMCGKLGRDETAWFTLFGAVSTYDFEPSVILQP